MSARLFLTIVVFGLIVGSVSAQTYSRRASQMGGGNPDRGKCTIEVVVDGAAEVEVSIFSSKNEPERRRGRLGAETPF